MKQMFESDKIPVRMVNQNTMTESLNKKDKATDVFRVKHKSKH